jgi:CBS domain-containing protein
MARKDVGPIPVVEDGALIGLVTDRDIVIRVVPRVASLSRRPSARS